MQSPDGEPISDVTVTNLSLEALFAGIVFDTVTDGLIKEVQSTIPDLVGTHIALFDSDRNQLIENSIESGGLGILLSQSNENVLTQNTSTDTFFPGIELVESNDNWLLGNTVIGADGLGISLRGADGNRSFRTPQTRIQPLVAAPGISCWHRTVIPDVATLPGRIHLARPSSLETTIRSR
ncbi:right-handed parallel beta-helix repeat-containing protein [Natronolimnohabitans sp. A-GB9]|uniref:NosD domain-containing protein n=1 Tax=Natronolimnohabitans sp. A-GB9 TaxID=3069757 RepID=UPI0027AE195F|nr:NosD domain-containing protein [Natronolimnohabitans sp. A-GB9]MDQ2049206.1 right-handed parallel beta-helix repeat-containing protein [Natronolimnohabitans sp. A-GB9]